MKALRLALVAGLVVGASFAVTHTAHAQGNVDDAHELCAQGGGEDESGDGGSGFNTFDPDDPRNETAAFGNGQGGSDEDGGAGGGGPGGGLGGAEGVGGGAGGCGRDVPDRIVRRPVIIQRPVVRRTGRNLPVTGVPETVAYMGGAFVLAGGTLIAANRRRARLEAAASDGLVWDAFGGARMPWKKS